MSLLSVKNLCKSFGGVLAVDEVSFDVQAGELCALIGPNGAGKSTLFNLLNGQLSPDSGAILLHGHSIVGAPPRDIWRRGIGRTFQIPQVFLSLTVIENIQMTLLSASSQQRQLSKPVQNIFAHESLALLSQVGLAHAAQRSCHELAYSDLKRVELAMAIAHRPTLLLMDEPTAGMGSNERHALMALVKQAALDRQMGVLFTEHSTEMVFAFADRLMVMARGRLLADGAPKTVRQHPAVIEAYFGSPQAVTPAINSVKHEQQRQAPLLKLDGLSAWYGQAQALFDLNLRVDPGEVVTLIGRNGAGKSTTMKAIMGLIAKRRGRVEFRGKDISNLETHQIAAQGLGFVPEDRRIFADLTVLENLEIGRQTPRGLAPCWTIEQLFTLFPNLAKMPHRLGSQMSGGEQQMLTVARSLMGNPHLVLMDEPSEGIAPMIVEQMIQTILQLKRQGVSVLLSEQNFHFAASVSDRVYVLEHGSVVFTGSMSDLAEDPDFKKTILML